MTNRKHYTREFKLEAVRLLETSDKPITAVARELGVRRTSGVRVKGQSKP